jgi:type IV secretion system protein VirB6
MSFLSEIESNILGKFVVLANDFGMNLLIIFRPAFITGFAIWIMLIAYEVAFGKSEDGLGYLLTKIFKIFLIGSIALWGWPEISYLLQGIKKGFVGDEFLSTILEDELLTPLWQLFENNLAQFIKSLKGLGLTDITIVLQNYFYFLIMNVAYAFLALIVACTCCIAIAMYMVSSCIFVLLLAVGPFFLLCLAFPFTQKFFENFIGQIMTSILACGFTIFMTKLVADIYGLRGKLAYFDAMFNAPELITAIKLALVFILSQIGIGILMLYMFIKIFDLASGLGGGINMGNNMAGALRTIARDLAGRNGAAGGKNQMSNDSSSGGSGQRPSFKEAMQAKETFTAMGISAANRGAMAVGRGIASAGKFAYNRVRSKPKSV